MRINEFSGAAAAQQQSLYVCRPLRNPEAIVAWAREQGFPSCLPDDDFHVTIAYSREKVCWDDTTPMQDTIRVSGGKRRVARLGNKGAVVLHFESEALHERWADLINDVGCSWDYEGYQPHVSITYRGADLDLANVAPYTGILVFGPEQFNEPDADFADKLDETDLTDPSTPVAARESRMTLAAPGQAGDPTQLDPHEAYALFRTSYERETGTTWSLDKFVERARNWEFYGDATGFVAIRRQRGGLCKLVGVAGDRRAVLKGIGELTATGEAIWGAVSAPLAQIAQKRGMIAPSLLPGGPLLLRTLIKTIPASVFGGVVPEVREDGGLVFDYPDTGRAVKYLIGNKAYFRHALTHSAVAETLRANAAVRWTLRLLGLGEV